MTETYPPEIGGAAMCAARFAEGLAGSGHELELVRPRQRADGTEARPGVRLVRGFGVPWHPGLQLGWPGGRALARAWRERRPDIVHVVTEGPLGWSAALVARRLGIPVTSSFHTNFHAYGAYYGLGGLRGLALGYLRAFHNATARTLVPTAQMAERLAREGFRRLAVVGRGVDVALFDPRRRRSHLRTCWGAKDGLVALYVGRLAPEKNIGLVLRAHRAMTDVRPDTRLVVVGDGPLRRALERQHPGVIFTGRLAGEELAAHYASADVFLFPSLTEAFGNVVLEAMASGLAVIAFNDGAAAQHVRPGQNGLLAPCGDEAEFLALARRLAAGSPAATALRVEARATALQFGWASVVAGLVSVLEDAVREAASAAGRGAGGWPTAVPSQPVR